MSTDTIITLDESYFDRVQVGDVVNIRGKKFRITHVVNRTMLEVAPMEDRWWTRLWRFVMQLLSREGAKSDRILGALALLAIMAMACYLRFKYDVWFIQWAAKQ